jgi:hypothetical protein
MRPKSVTVTSGNSPYYIPLSQRQGTTNVVATPNSGNYDVAYTLESIGEGAASVTDWIDVTNMSAATAQQTGTVTGATCLRITLNSGTSVKVDISQQNV